MAREILFQGFSRDEILRLPAEQIEKLILTGEPIIFSVGTARILGEFRLRDNYLLVTLAQIEGGGEGVLPSLWLLIEDYARSRSLKAVEMDCSCGKLRQAESKAQAGTGAQGLCHPRDRRCISLLLSPAILENPHSSE